jgi:type VI secretion system secreted protein Hcp
MAYNVYAKFEGIDGQSTDADHKNWVDVFEFNHGCIQQHDTSGTKQSIIYGGTGRCVPFEIVIHFDKSAPKLNEACVKGLTIPKIELHVCQLIGGKQQEVMSIIVENARITHSVTELSKSGSDNKVDGATVMLHHTKVIHTKATWKVTEYKNNGTKGGVLSATHDPSK